MPVKSNWLCYVAGSIFLALPGLISVPNRLYFVGLLTAGWACTGFGLAKVGVWRPVSAVVLVLATNSAFWLSYGLFKLRPRLVGPVQAGGIDPFASAVSIWLVTLLICALYEGIVLTRGLCSARQRQLAAIGLVGALLQIPTTLRFVYTLIEGI